MAKPSAALKLFLAAAAACVTAQSLVGRAGPYDTPCQLKSGQNGVCIPTSNCSSGGGTSSAGFCPGAADIQVRADEDRDWLTGRLTRVGSVVHTANAPWTASTAYVSPRSPARVPRVQATVRDQRVSNAARAPSHALRRRSIRQRWMSSRASRAGIRTLVSHLQSRFFERLEED
jgi:hypothetical protein